jgi:hypothetical protein
MKTYNTKEVCNMFNLSTTRLSHFRKGQQVKVKSKKNHQDRVYTFDPILQENKDWFWKDSNAIFTESAIQILKNRKKYRKLSGKGSSTQTPNVRRKYIPKKGFLTFPDVSAKLKISIQKIYALRDNAKNIPKSATNKHILRLNKDWILEDGKVLLKVEAVEKIKDFFETRKKTILNKNKKLTILQGKNVVIVSGEKARKILDILENKKYKN